jgi:phospholipid/cholesterol/gamma-HCH transport system permease protein
MKPGLSFNIIEKRILEINFEGDWTLRNQIPSIDMIAGRIAAEGGIREVSFNAKYIGSWDSAFLIFLVKLMNFLAGANVGIDPEGLPTGAGRLLSLASKVPAKIQARKEAGVQILERVGNWTFGLQRSFLDFLEFIGEVFIAFIRLLRGRASFRWSDLILNIQQCGAQALPIVSLVSILVGIILAFIGAIQLKLFGAQIYVASLVGIAMVRALAAVMTAIIMSGRTGASFAAQIGTMQVNEEIDALNTFGISPIEFLVLPRIIALSLMMPLLSVYSDLLGILGGLIIGTTMLDLNFMEYYNKTSQAVSLNDFFVGIFSATVFGLLVSLSGCMRGMRCGRSASAVGEATTSAVVTSIVGIVVATALITAICNVLDI